jgi:hypothetical protein
MASLLLALPFSLCSASLWAAAGTENYERAYRNLKDLPQYRYLSRPVYKFVASKTNVVFATAASFFVTDLLLHQLLPGLCICGVYKITHSEEPCHFYHPGISLAWLAMGIPVMYAKYRRSSASCDPDNRPTSDVCSNQNIDLAKNNQYSLLDQSVSRRPLSRIVPFSEFKSNPSILK